MSVLPEVNCHVGLVAEGSLDVLSTRVEDSGEGWVAIACPAAGSTEVDLPAGSLVTLQWATARGLRVADCVVRGPADVGVPAVVVDLAGEPQLVQRRQHVRTDAFVRIAVTPAGPTARKQPAIGTTLDVAGGGMRARVPHWLAEGDQVNVRVCIDDDEDVTARARVVRRVDEETVAFEFDEMPLSERERLVRYVFRRLRAALRVRDG